MPMAKAVISSPAWETLTPRSPDSSGSRPVTTNSVVPIRNVPAASTQTTRGSLPGVVPDAEGMCVNHPVVGELILDWDTLTANTDPDQNLPASPSVS